MDYKKYDIFRDYDDYIIFSTGKIYSLKRNRFLKPYFNRYYKVSLIKNKIQKSFHIHRILGICFLENPYNLPEMDHIDRNTQNNNLSNLRWSSRTLQNINRNIQKSNKLGIKGVCFCKNANSYIASWNIDDKQFTKTFSLKIYGDKAKQLAIDYRAKMVEKYYKNVK
jgi:hypothetical protein